MRVIVPAVFLPAALLIAPIDAAYEIRSLARERTLSILDEDSFYSTPDLSGQAFVDVCNAHLSECRVRAGQSDPTVVGTLMELVDSTGSLAGTITDFFQRWSQGDATLVDIGPVLAVLFTELEIGQILGVLTESDDTSNPTSITEILSVLLGGLFGVGGDSVEENQSSPGPISSLISFFLDKVFADNEQRVVEAGHVSADGNNTTIREDIVDSLLGSIDLAQLELDAVLSQLIGLFVGEGTADAIVAVVRVFLDILSILIPSGASVRRRELMQQLVAPSGSSGDRKLKRHDKKDYEDDDDDTEHTNKAKAQLGDEEGSDGEERSRTEPNHYESSHQPSHFVETNVKVHPLFGDDQGTEPLPGGNPVVRYPGRGQPATEESDGRYPERGQPVSEESENSFQDSRYPERGQPVSEGSGNSFQDRRYPERGQPVSEESGSRSRENGFPQQGQFVSEESESSFSDSGFPRRGPPISQTSQEEPSTSESNERATTAPFERLEEILESIKPREKVLIPHEGHFHEISSLDENLTLLRDESNEFFDKLRFAAISDRDGGIFSADANDPRVRGDIVDQFVNLLNLDLIVTIVGGLTSLLGTLGGTSDPQGPFSYLASFIALVGEVLGQGEESNIFFSLSGLLQTIASLTVFQGSYQYLEATFPRAFPDSIQPDLQLASEMIDIELSEILTLLQSLAAGDGIDTETMSDELECRLELLACEASETVLH